jgi:hypothetical protein
VVPLRLGRVERAEHLQPLLLRPRHACHTEDGDLPVGECVCFCSNAAAAAGINTVLAISSLN